MKNGKIKYSKKQINVLRTTLNFFKEKKTAKNSANKNEKFKKIYFWSDGGNEIHL